MKTLDQHLCLCVGVGIQQLMRMSVTAKKALEPQHVAVVDVTENDGAARPALQYGGPTQDQRPHDALAEVSFGNDQRPQAIGGDDESLDRLLRHSVRQRGPARQLRHLADEVAWPNSDDRLVHIQLIVLGNNNTASEDNDKT